MYIKAQSASVEVLSSLHSALAFNPLIAIGLGVVSTGNILLTCMLGPLPNP